MSSHHYRYRPAGFQLPVDTIFFGASVAFRRASWALRSSASWASKSFSILSTLTAANFSSDLFVLSRNSCLAVVKFSCVSRKAEAAASTRSAFFSTVFFDVWNFFSMSVEHFEAISLITSSIWSFKMSVFVSDQATLIAPSISPGLNVFRTLLLQRSSALSFQNCRYDFFIPMHSSTSCLLYILTFRALAAE